MFPARKGAGHRRRRRGPVAIGVAVLGAGAAGVLLLSPAHAGTVQPPVLDTVAQPPAPAPAALSARIAGAVKADNGPARAPLAAPTTTKSSGTAGTTVDPKIIGGTTTTISTAPWMAQLWYYDDNGTPADETDDTGFFCGGTVVSPTKILTASHCVHGYDWFQFGAVVTGTDQLPTSNADDTANLHGGTATGVQRQWNHPSYSSVTYDNDVAVLTLNRPVTAKPLPITTAGDTASYGAGTAATLYGWGRTSSATQDLAQTLKKASMPIVSNAACSNAWGSDYVAAHMVCAGPPASGSDTGTTSACNGDSGGPLVVAGRVVGVVSWGVEDCVEKGAYSVFSRVTAFAGAIDPRLDDTDITHDGKADLLAVTPAGATYYYASKGTTVNGRVADGNLAGTSMIRQTDLNRDGFQDVLARTTDGQLYFLNGKAGTSDIRLGAGWNAMRALVAPGDLNGDGLPDLVATDAGGTMWYYPGNGNGTVGARHSVGGGWNIYNGVIYGKGDLSGDGRPDLVARDSAGVMWLYKGSGSATKPFQNRTRIGAGWNIYNIIATVGDITGDGHADLVARDSAGVLWLYKGTGSATAPLAARTEICAGWNIYNKLG